MPRQTPRSLFLGRREELSKLKNRLDSAARGAPQIVLVDGPAGIGKTSLARHFLSGAAAECCVLKASGEELEMELAYGVIAQFAAQLPDVPNALRELALGMPDAAPQDPIGVGALFLDALGQIQSRAPVVLLIDDVHWADTPSLHALTFALRRLRMDRVLAVLLTRDASDPRLPQGLHRILHDDTTLTLTLEGLGLSDIVAFNAALGPSALPRSAIARLREHTHGNPLHTKALLQQFPGDVLGGHTVLPAPRRYERLVAGHLARCSASARDLVEAASVLGMSSSLHQAARIGAVPDPLSALAEAMTYELLEEDPANAVLRITFPHPLLRAAVYRGLDPAERSRLHHLAAAQSEDHYVALQHRVQAAVAPNEDLADELIRFATQESERGAWAAAASAAIAAARLSTHSNLRERWLVQAVEYRLLAGDVRQAAEFEPMVRDREPDAQQQYVLGHLALTTGRLEEARQRLAACWESSGAGTEAETLQKAAEQMAWLCLIQGDAPNIVRWARRGLALPPGRRSSFLRDSLAIGLAISGRYEEGIRSLADLPLSGPRHTPDQLDGLLARGMLQLWNGQLREAGRDLREAFASHRRGGLPYAALVALAFLTDTEYRAGLWDEAIAHGTQAVSLAEDTDQISILAVVHALTAFPLAGRGDFEAAEAHARAAMQHARTLADVNDGAFAATALALVHSARGDDENTVAELSPFLSEEIVHRSGLEEVGIVPWRPLLSEALTRLGRKDEALEVLIPYESGATERGRWLEQASAARCRGSLQEAYGNHEAADHAFREGLQLCRQGAPCWEEALLHFSYGAFLRRTGQRKKAVAELESAHTMFLHLQAAPYLERCVRELAGCGRVTARRGGVSPAKLTAQELTVARLARRGMSNREIARELVLSVKTIEYHLGNVYTKLGITSRMGLIAKLDEEP
ncbi:helix-turn-helix transcriptional regulator [Streptomyces sp. BPTC-684]|uniref:AAA family ATPase n=1 Tax=Streptomyces sp. BPTC-684 TaxID=3043734 RepID=UPI0024B1447D|nr:helix-turn-helix transcriptional regulator [Streptomyces sp. BPTC-684]WHM40946.1 AAA family ATPase [Streptomyces sp. BPTC-684]